jgi:hypothetical protein
MTLVSFRHGFIFLKSFKTASTSVEMYLQPFCMGEDVEIKEASLQMVSRYGVVGNRLKSDQENPNGPDDVPKWAPHMKAKQVRNRVGKLVWNNFEKISVVRNPFTRVLSGFYWSHRNEVLPTDQDELLQRFRSYAKNRAPIMSERDKEIMDLDGKFILNTTLHTETIVEDLEKLTTRLGLDSSKTSLPRTKDTKSGRPNIQLADWYDESTTKAVTDSSAHVFERFGYETRPNDGPPKGG